MDPTAKGTDELHKEGSAASNDAALTQNKAAVPTVNKAAVPAVNNAAVPAPSKVAASDPSKAAAPDPSKVVAPGLTKAAAPDPSKASAPDPSKAAAPDPSKAAAPDPSKASALDPSKASAPDPSKASAPDPSKASAPDPSKAAAPGLTKAAAPDLSKAAAPGLIKAAVPDPSKAAAPGLTKAAAPDLSKAAAPGLTKSAAPDPSKVVAPVLTKAAASDPSKAAVPDSSKAVEAAVSGEPSKSVGDGPTKGGNWFRTSWLKIKPNFYVLVTLAYFLACNAALVIHGLCAFVRGLVRFVDTRRKFSNPQVMTTETTNGIISIIIGSVAIAVGSFGLFCTLMKNRILSTANLVVLFLSILGFVIFIFLYLKDTADFVAEEKSSTREGMHTLYDISAVKASKQFTAAINRIQQKNKCCGWSGEDRENIFLKTLWFKKVNMNSSSQSQFLPESCCSGAKLGCLSFKDMKAARDKRLIHPRDCWDMIAEEFNTKVNGVLIELIVGSVIQALCIIPPVMSYAWIGIQLLRSRFASRPKK